MTTQQTITTPPANRISPCLWFDGNGEEAANFYCGIFPNSKITRIIRWTEAGREMHGATPGDVLAVNFELDGQLFMALNGGPNFKFNEAISLQVACRTQEEIDHYWARLGEGGDPKAQQCGWLKDKFGVSWQVYPERLLEMHADPDREKAGRAMLAMMSMKKFDIAELERAFRG